MVKKRVKAGTSRAEAAKRRALFVQAYIANGGNGTQAAIKAGFSEKTAEQQASRLLRDVNVSGAIESSRTAAIAAAEAETGVSMQNVLRELGGILHSDLRECFDKTTGALLPPHQWPERAARAIASVKVVEMAGGMKVDEEGGVQHVPMYTKEVKLWDKNSAIDKAMKHLGMYEIDNRQKPPPTVNIGRLTVGMNFDKVRARAKGQT